MSDKFNFQKLVGKSDQIKLLSFFSIIIIFLLNAQIINCANAKCPNDTLITDTNCFNNLIIFNSSKYRAGHFVTTKNGDLIIEFSVDDSTHKNARLFYGLKSDGRYFFSNESSTYELNITGGSIQDTGRYESRNLIVTIENDPINEYILSVSSYTSVVELHNLNSENDTHFIWTPKNFFGFDEDYIFSYEFSLFELKKNESTYIIIFNPRETSNGENTDAFIIKKFRLKSFDSNAYDELNSIKYSNNFNNRIVNMFSMDDYDILVVFYVENINTDTKIGKYAIRFYDYNLEYKNNITIFGGELSTLNSGWGIFFKGFYLKEKYATFIYFTEVNNGKSLNFRLSELSIGTNGYDFSHKIAHTISDYNFYTFVSLSDFLKINDKRIAFISTVGSSKGVDRFIYFLLFDLYDNYTRMRIRVYYFKINDFIFKSELSGYIYNGYFLFDTTSIIEISPMNDGDPSWSNYFSIFMIFGYANGTDSIEDISYFFENSL